MSQEIQNMEMQLQKRISKNSGLIIVTGIVILLLGLVAMGSPLIAGFSVVTMVGFVLLLGGLGQMMIAFNTGKGMHTMISGVLAVVAGGYMLMSPESALALLTSLLAAYLLIAGIAEIVISFRAKAVRGSGWILFSGIVSILLAVMIFSQYPLSGTWAIGILLGVKMFISGLTLIMIGMSARGVNNN